MKRYLAPALWIVAFEAVSFAIGMSTQGNIDEWYSTLVRPALAPPNAVFPVVWTALYALIALAGWRLWQERAAPHGNLLLALFGLYMGLNWSWSFVFFGAQMLLTGFVWIIAMNFVAVALIALCWQGRRQVALLMVLPTLWTTFAAALNGAFWLLNS